MLGASGVGKTSLCAQFLSSDHINTYDRAGTRACSALFTIYLNRALHSSNSTLYIVHYMGVSVLCLFWNFKRIQMNNDSYWQYVFTFCKMSENVLFFEHIHSKFAESANMTSKNLFFYKLLWSIKKRRILCWFEVFKKKFTKKILGSKTMRILIF
jgi:hypothetical protein